MVPVDLPGPAPLDVHITPTPDGPLARLSGELDLSNVAQVEEQLEAVLKDPSARLSFDLAGLRFMDSSGLAVLLRAAARVERIRLLRPTDAVRRLIEATGLTNVLPIEP